MCKTRLSAIDLFAGAGGLSVGLAGAGFEMVAAVESDAWAAGTYAMNHPVTRVIQSDIRTMSDSELREYRGVDAVVGGPPCQGFSIAASNRRKPQDPRNFLYREFVRAVAAINPRVVCIENVKEILRAKADESKPLLRDLTERLEALGYRVTHALLDAARFGVPQHRVRFFLIASRGAAITLHDINTHGVEGDLLIPYLPLITLGDAISDLPWVEPGTLAEDAVLPYDQEPVNEYQSELRRGSTHVTHHIPMRHTRRMIERFRLTGLGNGGDQVPAEHRARSRSNPATLSGIVYDQNHRRLDANAPCRTITASFYSSFIHPSQHRNLTVREAARIQSFPDSYKFSGKRTTLSKKLLARKGIVEDLHLDQFNQVGNAVPPRMAQALGNHLINSL
jgi:DNA (cytosine-5)-methyltransferase 1